MVNFVSPGALFTWRAPGGTIKCTNKKVSVRKYCSTLYTGMQMELKTLGIFCKYGHVHQAKGEPGQALVLIPPLKQTTNHPMNNFQKSLQTLDFLVQILKYLFVQKVNSFYPHCFISTITLCTSLESTSSFNFKD